MTYFLLIKLWNIFYLYIYIFFLEIINNFMPDYDIVFLINIVYKYNGLV